MALLSSSLLIRTHSLTLLLISYYLLTTPLTLLTSSSLLVLGDSMHIRPASFQPSPSRLSKGLVAISSQSTELLGIVAVILSVYAVQEFLLAGGLSIPSSLRPATSSGTRAGRDGREGGRSKARMGEDLASLTSSQSHHLNISFLHILGSGALCAWIYIFHSDRSESFFSRPLGSTGGLGSVLANQIVFSASLMDMLFWGYLWTVIRDERREVLGRVQMLREGDDEEEEDE